MIFKLILIATISMSGSGGGAGIQTQTIGEFGSEQLCLMAAREAKGIRASQSFVPPVPLETMQSEALGHTVFASVKFLCVRAN
jgi:hypothetical protein